MLLQAIHKTPAGELFLVSDEHILLAAGFQSHQDLISRMDKTDNKREFKKVKQIPIISDLIEDYFMGDLTALGGIKVRQPGPEFSQDAWKSNCTNNSMPQSDKERWRSWKLWLWVKD